jgi:hypothetical protein
MSSPRTRQWSSDNSRLVAFLLVLLAMAFSAAIWIYAAAGNFVCATGTIDEHYQRTVAALDGTVALTIQIATTLVGFGAAALIGLNMGMTVTARVRMLLAASVLMFAQAAICASWWRFGIAQAWFNKCLSLVAEGYLHNRFQAHLLFFMGGLLMLGMLVIASAIIGKNENAKEG